MKKGKTKGRKVQKYLSDKGYYVIGVPPKGAHVRNDTLAERRRWGCWNLKPKICDCPPCGGFND